MVRPHKKECAERETQVEIALKGIRNGTYVSIDHAVKVLDVARTTLRRSMKGGKTRKEAREATQLLTAQDEKAIVDWITTATTSGNPVTHSYIREMADAIRASYANAPDEFLRPCGTSWLQAFFQRHPQLQTRLSKAIEFARIKNVTREQVINFNNDFRRLIHEKNIRHINIYNCDETGNLHIISG